MRITTKPLSKDLWADFVSYFEFGGTPSGCWCMNHRLPMGLDFEGEAAKLAMKQLVETQRVFGLLAYTDGEETPIGWLALDRKKTLPGHDCIGEKIDCSDADWSIHCVTSRSDYRGKGVEQKLCEDAVFLAKELKAKTLESYPEPQSEVGKDFKTWNVFNGYQSHFAELEFVPSEFEYDNEEAKPFFQKMHRDL